MVRRLFGTSQRVLLTGRPGCGKTTLIKRILNGLPHRFGGLYTEEIRDQADPSRPTRFATIRRTPEPEWMTHLSRGRRQSIGSDPFYKYVEGRAAARPQL